MLAMIGSVRPVQVPIVGIHVPRGLGCAHSGMASRFIGQGLRCWRTDDRGTLCSDLKYHPPGCPSAPPVTEAETLPTPPEAAQAVCGGGGITVSPSALPGAAAAPPTGAPAPSAFPTTTVLVVGGLAAAGLVAFLALR